MNKPINRSQLPYLGCITSTPWQCCGDRRYPSGTRFQPAGPAVITHEWDIGNRECAGGLKKCTNSKCGNKFCSIDGKCKDGTVPYIAENYNYTYSYSPDVEGVL